MKPTSFVIAPERAPDVFRGRTGVQIAGVGTVFGVPIAVGPTASGDFYVYDTGSDEWVIVNTSSLGTGWFNLKAYGAVRDSTTDDTSAINSAIAAYNAAGGGVLYCPGGSGYYKCTGALTPLTAPGLVLGDGSTGSYDGATLTASKIVCTDGTANFLTISAGVTVRGLSLVNTAGSVTAGYGIGGTDMNLCHFEDVSVIGFWINFDIDGGIWSWSDCYSRQPHKYGVDISYAAVPDGGDWSMKGGYITDGANSSDAGIHQTSGGGGRIEGIKINGNSSGFNHGIDVHIPNGVATSDLHIIGAGIENFRGDGIHIQTDAGGTFSHIELIGNQIAADISSNTTGNGISITANTAGDLSGVTIVGNAIIPNGSGTSSGAAVLLTKADRVLVASNVWSSALGNYTIGLSQSGCTNVLDYTGGVGAGVSITGTPNSGDVPIASSGTSAAWGPASGTSAADANIWRPVVDGAGAIILDGSGQAVMAYGPA